jgi:thioredoxin-related protein
MKTYLLLPAIIFSVTLSLVARSQTPSQPASPPPPPAAPLIKWMSFEEAYALNKKKPKKIFIDVYTDWCGWCKKMDATTFSNPVIAGYMNKTFYCVKLDAERKDTVVIDGHSFVNTNPLGKRSSHQLAIELLKGQMSYPSYVFLNEQSQYTQLVPGYQQPAPFEAILHYFGDNAFGKVSWEEFKATFKGSVQ